jgi:hypothetical protein
METGDALKLLTKFLDGSSEIIISYYSLYSFTDCVSLI